MYIKRLEIVGFKSFPERVLVPLSQGISAVVGPNGCGKSNIIDAIRWVMGEQSPKMLRGRNMDDVLFNGSQGRPASALAEVTLTLARDGDPASGYSGAAETSVTRRLYRSGDSEYLINRVPGRLKDVIHFFTDQGVGTRAYGIIEQGRVGWLVDARPEERRGLIDEAAGITRYKQQKKEAERKIESAEANLVNVSVIKAETKKQLDQITRAAAKAARYKALKEELRDLDLTLTAKALTEARRKRRELTVNLAENKRLLTSLLAEANTRELEMDALKLEVTRAEKVLEEKTAAWHQLVAARDGLAKEAEFARANLSRSEERRVLALGELARIASERRRKLEEEAQLTEDLGFLEQEEREAREHTENLREEWRAHKSSFDGLNREAAEADRLRSDLERQAAKLTAELAGGESLLAHHQERLASLSAEAEAASAKVDETERLKIELAARKERVAAELGSAREESASAAEALALAERELTAARGRRAEAEAGLSRLQAKLETLKNVKDNFGWYPQGVKALMAAPELVQAGLIGPLAEHLNIPDGFEEAAEAALGERLAWLVVENRAAALAALKYAADKGLGRCGFICRDELAADGRELSRAVLGDYQLAENLLSEVTVSGGAVLTRQGQYAGGGLIAGGQGGPGGDDAGLLARLKEVESLTRKEGDSVQACSRAGDLLVQAEETAEIGREAARAAEAMVQSSSLRLTEVDKALALASSEADQAQSRHQNLEAEKARLETEAQTLSRSMAEGRARREAALAAADQASEKAERLKGELTTRSEALEELRSAGEEARMRSAAKTAKLDQGRHDLERVSEWLNDVEDNLAAKEAESAALAEEIDRLGRDLKILEERTAAFPDRLQAAESELTGQRELLADQRRKQEAKEAAAKDIRRRREELNSLLAGQETELVSAGFAIDKAEEDLRRDWLVLMPDPEEAGQIEAVEEEPGHQAPEPEIDRELPEPANVEEPVQDGPESVNEPALAAGDSPETEDALPSVPTLESLDPREWSLKELPEGAAARRDALRVKIGSLGEVSLGAIEREVELRAEYERYQSQYDDLTRAIADLKDSINRINHTCKIRFAETFAAVDAKFREIFPVLFEGGEGWISLTDDSDPLESGVEIHVHPPGKKVLVMSLLSGGEKALTALALIFALYLIKPSPFCLLDETDAPLDEANIDRFNRLLRQLSRASQIIMVTHNKRTMQICHTLYGVTMETPGVSRLVSVNLAEAEAMTTDA